MNKEIKQRWIKALKSGAYPQEQSHLRTERGFCCLGVLTDLYIQETEGLKWELDRLTDDRGSRLYSVNNHTASMPEPICIWAEVSDLGMLKESLFVENEGMVSTLAKLNDSGFSFDEIAKIIEEQL